MAIAFRAASYATRLGSSAPMSFAVPAGTASGDLLLMVVTSTNGLTAASSGWTSAGSKTWSTGGDFVSVILWKIAGPSEPAASVTTASTSHLEAMMAAFSGVATSPFDVAAVWGAETTSSPVSVPALTTVTANALRLVVAVDATGGGLSSSSKPSGWTQHLFHPADLVAAYICDSVAVPTAGSQSATTYPIGAGKVVSAQMALRLFVAAVTPVADFTGTPLTGTSPLSVVFTDSSTNTPTSWAWTFGDGGTSTAQNPTHSYTAAGTYTVALVATNSAGSNTKTRTGYVTVSAPVTAPVAEFSASPLSGDRPLTVAFTDLSG